MYIPKTKYKKRTVTVDPNIYLVNICSKPYSGPYVQLSNGNKFVGTDANNSMGQKLIVINSNPTFIENRPIPNKIYNVLNKNIFDFLSHTQPIIPTKPPPTEKDYTKGHYFRYFAKKLNETSNYQEINKETYNKIKSKSPKYDYNLYTAGSITWHLIGNVFKKNKSSIAQTRRKFKHVHVLFRLLDEFYRPALKTENNLNTEGGELFYVDKTEYIGLYHIHPTKGPMEGPTHTEESHKKLYYENQLPNSPDSSYAEFLDTQKGSSYSKDDIKKEMEKLHGNMEHQPSPTTTSTEETTTTSTEETTTTRRSTSSPGYARGGGY